ncbi:hypothetical protein BC828DRAFT_404202 [Blastocladiella britannica]|nr:hypothetical protein BC828DRAFT_404202 [Blastocladiella britannica]
MAKPKVQRKKSLGKAPPPPTVGQDEKYFVKASDRAAVFGLDGLSDDSDDDDNAGYNGSGRRMRGEDVVNAADDDHVLELDMPSDSDVSDAEADFADNDDDNDGPASSGWGKGRRAFYSADDTFADDDAAKMEETEALRMRKERMAKLSEADFLDGAFATVVSGSASAAVPSSATTKSTASTAVHMEVIEKRAKDEMSRDEILEHLATASPDLLEFVLEFQSKLEDARESLLPMLTVAKRLEPAGSPVIKYLATKYTATTGFLLNVSFYLTMYARGTPRREIMRHPVVGVLVLLKRQLADIEKLEQEKPWLVQSLEPIVAAIEDMDEHDMDIDEYLAYVERELEREAAEDSDDDESVSGDDDDLEEEEVTDSDMDVSGNDSDMDLDEVPPVPAVPRAGAQKRSRAVVEQAPGSDNSDDDDDTLAALPAKKRKRVEAQLAAMHMQDPAYKPVSKKAAARARANAPTTTSSSSRHLQNDDDFDDAGTADANFGIAAGTLGYSADKKPLRKLVQSVHTTSRGGAKGNKASMSADADVARKSRKRNEELNAHLSKDEIAAAERDADVFSDDEPGSSATASKGGRAANIDEAGINLNKVDPNRPISSLVEDRARKLAKRTNVKARKLATREGIEFEDAVKRVRPDDTDDFDMNDMSGTIKREASYKILKNRGLHVKRPKDDGNPRVKHRKKYEARVKKIKTVKRVAAELKSGYQGELTGIKTNLTRQVNLSK